MNVAGVVGSGADDVARELVGELQGRGRVARIQRGDTTTDGGALVAEEAADTSYVVGDDHVRVTAAERPLVEILDGLAPDHDYAIVTGYSEARIPFVTVGRVEFHGEVIAELHGDEPTVEDAVEAIEGTEPRETLESLVARLTESPDVDRAGAVATFTGRVRTHDDPEDSPTTRLEYEAYDGVADERMAAIAEEIEARDGVYRILMHHRTGVVEAGEDAVFVVVLAGHRAEAFAAVSDGIDRLKAEVPIFKKEVTLDGEFWAHERD